MKHRKPIQTPKVQDTLSPDPNKKAVVSALANVIKIAPNICVEKRVCQGCGRGDRYGIGLHFILHHEDGSINTVCYTCGKRAAGETGLRLPSTPLEIEAREEESDLKLIRIARQKMEAKNGNI